MRLMMAAALALLAAGPVWAGVDDVPSRPGVTTRLLIEEGPDPWVSVVLFAGGAGVLNISPEGRIKKLGSNFLVRSRHLFQAHGAVAAVIDGPSDQTDSLYNFRETENHALDVGAVVKHLRAKYGHPVWLIGTSRGTTSVANAAVRLQGPDAPDGIVLTASMTEANAKGGSVPPMALEKVRIPVLIAHHRRDSCSVTVPGSVDFLARRFENAPVLKVLWYEDGATPSGRECGSQHYHGFIGIEETVVGDILAWIRAPKP